MSNSGCTFFRKKLKIKGKSTHLGRGFYFMDFDCDANELDRRVINLMHECASQPHLFEVDVNEDESFISIKRLGYGYYNTLRYARGAMFPLACSM